MAIYHLQAKVISRGAGRSAVAAAAYMSCSAILNDYDGVQHDYTRKQGLVWQQIFLPENAPPQWADRGTLWNAVEENEKTKDSRLAREFVVALPVEMGKQEWQSLLTEFIQEHFVSDGMCADVCIHDTDGHNPHAHIMVTVRPLAENGTWQYKTEKEYLCLRDGEEMGFTGAEFKQAQAEGWEKQYQYRVGKKKEYMTPSAAEAAGYERVSKTPKSTRFGRQNPIAARWNSDEQLVLWRSAWADVTNKYLERVGAEARIDHRSHADRGIPEQPTIHEGVAARNLEKSGIASDRCEINRQIKADNALLRELKAQVKKLAETVQKSVAAIAEAMERLRANMLVFRYQLSYLGSRKHRFQDSMQRMHTDLEVYSGLVAQIKEKTSERKTALAEKKALPAIHIFKHRELTQRIAELTEALEELRSEKTMLLQKLQFPEDASGDTFRKEIRTLEYGLKRVGESEAKYTAELDAALAQYKQLRKQAEDLDPVELYDARQKERPAWEHGATKRLQEAHGDRFSLLTMLGAKQTVDHLLDEDGEERIVRERLRERSKPAFSPQKRPKDRSAR